MAKMTEASVKMHTAIWGLRGNEISKLRLVYENDLWFAAFLDKFKIPCSFRMLYCSSLIQSSKQFTIEI